MLPVNVAAACLFYKEVGRACPLEAPSLLQDLKLTELLNECCCTYVCFARNKVVSAVLSMRYVCMSTSVICHLSVMCGCCTVAWREEGGGEDRAHCHICSETYLEPFQ